MTLSDVHIERVFPQDAATLQLVSRQTFYEAFSAANNAQDMQSYLDHQLSIEQLTFELNQAGSEFYFALYMQEVIGYLKINVGDAQTELKDKKAMEIERIYVLKEFYGLGVGQMLCDYAIHLARYKDLHYVWLGVWEENHRAIRFYEKNGFETFDKHLFLLGSDEQTDLMMRRKL
jgi:ribosomal protein S18 acetylase RimI-like enzyme